MDVEKRIETLEKQVRLYRRVGLLAVCLIAGVLIVGAVKPVPKVIEAETIIAKKFLLKPDIAGKFFSYWAMTDDGPYFVMEDKKKEDGRKMVLNLDENGAALIIADGNGKKRFSVMTLKNKSTDGEYPAIFLFDKNGGNQVLLMARDRETPELGFFDSSGKLRVMLGLFDKKKPRLAMLDKKGIFRANMSLSENGEPYFEFLNEKGKMIWSAPLVSK